MDTPSKKTITLTEEELRAFNKCSEFFAFKGTVELPIKTAALEYVYIRLILDTLRQTQFDFKFALNRHLKYAERHLKLKDLYDVGEAQEILRHVAINADELFNLIRPVMYIPVFGPFSYPVKVSNTVVNLRIAAMLATNKNYYHRDLDRSPMTYHAVAFSPYSNRKDMENDMVQQVKLMTLSNANPVRLHGENPAVRLHIIGTKTESGLNYTYIDFIEKTMSRKTYAAYLEQPIKMIENGYHYPITPCIYTCPFKQVCGIKPDRVRET